MTQGTFTAENPEVNEMLSAFAVLQMGLFRTFIPDEWEQHESLVNGLIREDWHFAGTPWTGGIINNTAALPYHRDKGNVKGSWSSMLAIRDHMDGGALHLPEYDTVFGIPDGSVTLFDGQGTWHGVTPLVHKKPNSHRHTIVLYAKRGMVGTGTRTDEERNAKVRATKATMKGDTHERQPTQADSAV